MEAACQSVRWAIPRAHRKWGIADYLADAQTLADKRQAEHQAGHKYYQHAHGIMGGALVRLARGTLRSIGLHLTGGPVTKYRADTVVISLVGRQPCEVNALGRTLGVKFHRFAGGWLRLLCGAIEELIKVRPLTTTRSSLPLVRPIPTLWRPHERDEQQVESGSPNQTLAR